MYVFSQESYQTGKAYPIRIFAGRKSIFDVKISPSHRGIAQHCYHRTIVIFVKGNSGLSIYKVTRNLMLESQLHINIISVLSYTVILSVSV